MPQPRLRLVMSCVCAALPLSLGGIVFVKLDSRGMVGVIFDFGKHD